MASQEKPDKTGKPAIESDQAGTTADSPDWSHGLRQLYDSVVEEDLPDSFKELLDKLDDTEPNDIARDDTSHHPPRSGGGA